jgi:hypothetical protein
MRGGVLNVSELEEIEGKVYTRFAFVCDSRLSEIVQYLKCALLL